MEYLEETYFPKDTKLVPDGIIWKEHLKNYDTWEQCKIKTSIDSINSLLRDIPKYFQKHNPLGKKFWNTSSSYSSKHHVERMRKENNYIGDPYCSNGEFIFAMLYLNYEMKPTNEEKVFFEKKNKETGLYENYLKQHHPNPTFNCSYRDLSKIVCSCGVNYSKNSKKQHQRSKLHQTILINKSPEF